VAGRVFKRGSTWSYVVDVGRGSDGERKQRKKGGFATRRDAQRALRELLNTVDDGSYADPSSLTVGGYLTDRWLPVMQPPRLAASTWASYRYEIGHRAVPALGAVKLQQLEPSQLDAFYARLLREGGAGSKSLSQRTVRYLHTILGRAFKDAITWGLLSTNPADRATPPTQRAAERDRAEMRTWTAEQLRAFLDHVAGDRLFIGWLLAASTGMRRGEVLGLRWDDVDLDNNILSVRQALVMAGSAVQTSNPKTPRSRRTIDLDTRTVRELLGWRAKQNADRLRWGALWHDHGMVVTREDGTWVRPDSWTATFDRHVRRTGLPRLRLHDLRHTHATLLLKAGVPPKVVSERLGHSSVAFTLDTYAHVVPGMQADAAARFAKTVFGEP